MSFDGSFTHAMTQELKNDLLNGRVSKINEPYPNEIILTIRSNHNNYQLLLSANPSYARAQITNVPFTNPKVPTNFAMTLRKHLSGSFISKVHQVNNDRIIHLHFNTRNELGDIEELVLVIEIMARHSNIILVQAKDSTIIDSVKRISSSQNRYRTILPGSKYIQPPKQNLVDPFQVQDNEITRIERINREFPNVDVFASKLRKYLQGLGTDTAYALASALHVSGSSIKQKYWEFFDHFDSPKPVIGDDSKGKLQFSAFPYIGIEPQQGFDNLSSMLDEYYQTKVQRERVREQGSQLIRITKNELKKNHKKLKKLQKTLEESEHADDLRIKGEILMTYLNQVKVGSKSIKLPNFYDDNKDIVVSLNPALSPSENAQKYFKKYDKKRNAKDYVIKQIQECQSEIDYFDNIESQIEIANPQDLSDIKTELKDGGYIKKTKKNAGKRRKVKVSKPEKFISDDGDVILVGKNNLQNDQLTLKTADKRDTWLHVQNIHGSHVIIRSFDPSDQTVLQAAELAAYFSKARESANVPVDYVKVKAVKKPNGGKPGFVTYRGQSTMYVTPSDEIVKHLRENNKKQDAK